MKSIPQYISLHCFFCMSTSFALPYKGYKPHHGSFVVCANCGRENDFTSLLMIAKKNAISFAQDYAIELTKNTLKKAFKGNKFIKLK